MRMPRVVTSWSHALAWLIGWRASGSSSSGYGERMEAVSGGSGESSGNDVALRTPIGILGGGQLARMTIEAASELGIDVVIADLTSGSPAARVARSEVVFPHGWIDDDALSLLASLAPTITLESEFVDATVLERLEALGSDVCTTPASLRIVQDKLLQKQALRNAAIPVAPFRQIGHPDDVRGIGYDFEWPLVLKSRRDGYDGYGNALVLREADVLAACESLGWPERQLFAEAFVEFERELAVIVVRGFDGQEIVYPVVETEQDPELHICRTVLAPAPIPPDIAHAAAEMGRSAVRAVGGFGTFGIEMFQLRDGSVIVNELAPRPHNSGHYSIEACETSQFANHVRAVLGLPLGEPTMRAPCAVMVNLLGHGGSLPGRRQIAAALAVPGAHLHLYGKLVSRPGRKMGHVTVLGDSIENARERASLSASRITT